jgi:hypothetical protein
MPNLGRRRFIATRRPLLRHLIFSRCRLIRMRLLHASAGGASAIFSEGGEAIMADRPGDDVLSRALQAQQNRRTMVTVSRPDPAKFEAIVARAHVAQRARVQVAVPPPRMAFSSEPVTGSTAIRGRRGKWVCSVCHLEQCFLAPRIWIADE